MEINYNDYLLIDCPECQGSKRSFEKCEKHRYPIFIDNLTGKEYAVEIEWRPIDCPSCNARGKVWIKKDYYKVSKIQKTIHGEYTTINKERIKNGIAPLEEEWKVKNII